TVLGSLAEFERELIRERTGEGRTRAKARGVRFGRPQKLTPHQRREILDRIAAGEIQADLARTYNVGEAPSSRLAARGPFGSSAAVGVSDGRARGNTRPCRARSVVADCARRRHRELPACRSGPLPSALPISRRRKRQRERGDAPSRNVSLETLARLAVDPNHD